MTKSYSFFHQVTVITLILLISKVLEGIMPIPMPASVIGLMLLFVALCTGIIKLAQVETVGSALVNHIGLLFVPAGISVINSLGIISAHPFLILGLIFISTVMLLVSTGIFSQVLVTKSPVMTQAPKEMEVH